MCLEDCVDISTLHIWAEALTLSYVLKFLLQKPIYVYLFINLYKYFYLYIYIPNHQYPIYLSTYLSIYPSILYSHKFAPLCQIPTRKEDIVNIEIFETELSHNFILNLGMNIKSKQVLGNVTSRPLRKL